MSARLSPCEIGPRILDYASCLSRENFAAAKEIREEVVKSYTELAAKLDGYEHYTLPNGDQYEAAELIGLLLKEIGRLANRKRLEAGDWVQFRHEDEPVAGQIDYIVVEDNYEETEYASISNGEKHYYALVRDLTYIPEMFA